MKFKLTKTKTPTSSTLKIEAELNPTMLAGFAEVLRWLFAR